MWSRFFGSKAWKKGLITAATSNLVTASVASAQTIGLLNSQKDDILATGIGLLAGTFVNAAQRGDPIPNSSDCYAPLSLMFFNIVLTELTLYMVSSSEDDRNKVRMWSSFTVSYLCFALAALINPRPNPAPTFTPTRAPAVAGSTFQDRFSTIKNKLGEWITQSEKDKNFSPALLKRMKKLHQRMEAFDRSYENLQGIIMQDPVTLPETGQTFERKEIERHIQEKNTTCPKSGLRLSISLKELPATNISIKTTIDEGLQEFEAEFKRLQEKFKLAAESKVETKSAPTLALPVAHQLIAAPAPKKESSSPSPSQKKKT